VLILGPAGRRVSAEGGYPSKSGSAVPAARISAPRAGRQVRIRHRFGRQPASARRRPTALSLSVDPKGVRTQPRTYTYCLHRQVGVVRQTMPLGPGPWAIPRASRCGDKPTAAAAPRPRCGCVR